MRVDKNKVELVMARKRIQRLHIIEAGVPVGTFNRLMNGADVKPVTVGNLAAALNVDPKDIIAERPVQV